MPKKTTQAIIDSNNDYIITVKKNQPSLHKLLEEKSSCFLAIDRDIQEEKSKGRETKVTVEVWDDLSCVKSIIRVIRSGKREGKPYEERIFYLSSLYQFFKYQLQILPSERKSRAEGCVVILSRIGITYYFLLITYLASF